MIPSSTPVAREYTCPNCGGCFRSTGEVCLVIHPPGTCCHYGDIDLVTGKNARLHDPSGQGGVRGPSQKWSA